ncbi:Pentatricopeptide repeat-containing protein [Musa troglodytarum]|uniref:Pentatricopeptide repeat-containing protein n=2 Tax=Musa troglodytarum TaxID=320322 RepID=A0A9E7JRL9_9LILI|nr:Pentatricopeptide repeat-containing protein [Musa troglodytarum]
MLSTLSPFAAAAAPTLPNPSHSPPHFSPRLLSHPSYLLLDLCADRRELPQFFPQVVKRGLHREHVFQTKLVALFSRFGDLRDATLIFGSVEDKTDELYHSLLRGHAKHSSLDDAVAFFRAMRRAGVRPAVHSFTYLLKACGDRSDLRRGREIHSQLIASGFGSNVFAMTAVVNMYAKCRRIEEARRMFDRMPERDLVAWNAIVAGYAQNGMAERALEMVIRLQKDGRKPDSVTLVSALPACANVGSLKIGKTVHAFAMKAGFDSLVNVSTALVDMYSKRGAIETARLVFDSMRLKNVVSWNSMIDGYGQNGDAEEAWRLFEKMMADGIQATDVTIMGALYACGELGDLEEAKWIHGFAIRLCLDKNIFVMTALVDLYAKCGSVRVARRLFDAMEERHVTTWNAMIDGYGTNGFGKSAIDLFEQMKRSSVKPNDITFLSVLSACGHSGLVQEGKKYFAGMKEDYGLEPNMDHYGCMVDLLGRAGRLHEAWDFIQKMPISPGISVYGAMLGACKIHKNVKLGEEAAQRLFELEPDEGGYHVLLANIYAAASMWEDVARVRTMMEKKGLQKTPGYSSIDLKNEMHTFYSGSTDHPQSQKIYTRLARLIDEIKAVGYVPDGDSLHDVEEDVKEQLLGTHSEKLAIAFGLINTTPGTSLQIRKNLRVCNDCHEATKFISQVTGREIIVRDMQRFHHFKNGQCSCGDYW